MTDGMRFRVMIHSNDITAISYHVYIITDLQLDSIRLDIVELADRLNEALVVLVTHPLNVLVMILYPIAKTLQKVLLLLPIIESATMQEENVEARLMKSRGL